MRLSHGAMKRADFLKTPETHQSTLRITYHVQLMPNLLAEIVALFLSLGLLVKRGETGASYHSAAEVERVDV